MIDVHEITELHASTVALWHTQAISNPYAGFLHAVCSQHQYNYLLWHEEDIARSPNMGDEKIAAVKRAIDGYNQKRNDGIEALAYPSRAGQPRIGRPARGRTPETPGSRSTGFRSRAPLSYG
jgi:hypothetical protein